MPRSTEALITPNVLTWARNSAGLDLAQAAAKVPIAPERLGSWEAGETRPTIKQLRKLAAAYRRPVALFFLSEPPSEFQPMHDFRRLPGQVAGTMSPELRLEIRRAIGRRDIAVELRSDLRIPVRPFGLTAELGDDLEQVGREIRETLGISIPEQFRWSPGYQTFNRWRAAVEGLDILVCQMIGVPTDESRGFSVSESVLPVVCLNIKDPPQARCFSMIHEVTHLILRRGGLCDLDDHTARPPEDLASERFCNGVAASTLMPADAVLAEPLVQSHRRGRDWPEDDIVSEANRFGVSREAFIRRLLTLGLVTEAFYQRKRREYEAERLDQQESRSEGFAPPDRMALSAAGPSFTKTVLESFYQERITASDVADFLDVRLKHLPKIEAALQSAADVG